MGKIVYFGVTDRKEEESPLKELFDGFGEVYKGGDDEK